jgi:hypothetical protein
MPNISTLVCNGQNNLLSFLFFFCLTAWDTLTKFCNLGIGEPIYIYFVPLNADIPHLSHLENKMFATWMMLLRFSLIIGLLPGK